MKFLSGADNVEKWNSGIWNEILMLRKEGQVRVIVSTHQVLLDALTHGFVTMDDLSLLIFDEGKYRLRGARLRMGEIANHSGMRLVLSYSTSLYPRSSVEPYHEEFLPSKVTCWGASSHDTGTYCKSIVQWLRERATVRIHPILPFNPP